MGITERKEREKERRRHEIIEAAEKLIFKNGFENITVEAVATAAELSKATVYLYFRNKEDLLFAIFTRGHELLYSLIDEKIIESSDIRTNLAAFFKSALKFQKEYPDYFDMFIYFMTNDIPIDLENSAYKEHCKVEQVYLNKWIDLVERGKAEGNIRNDLNAIPTMLIFWMQLMAFLKMLKVQLPILHKQFGVTEQSLLDEYLNLTLNGISAQLSKTT